MSTTTAARPRQTTMAGVMVMLAATFVVLSVWDTVSRLRSIETRESIERFLADAPGSGLGLSVESTIQVLHGIAIVAALCAVASVALGWQVLQRSKQARVALSVISVPLFVTGLVAGGFMSSIVAAATAMLWLSPSREWLAGLPIPEAAKPGQAGRDADVEALSGRSPVPPAMPPTAAPATGRPVSASTSPIRRPQPVTVALVLTVVVAGLVLVTTLASLVVLASQPDVVLEELRRQNPDIEANGVSESLLLTTSYISGGLAMVWSAATIVLAVLMARRRAWAARGLLVSAVVCAIFCAAAAFASPVALLPALAAIATVGCLRRPDVRAWFDQPR